MKRSSVTAVRRPVGVDAVQAEQTVDEQIIVEHFVRLALAQLGFREVVSTPAA